MSPELTKMTDQIMETVNRIQRSVNVQVALGALLGLLVVALWLVTV